MPWRHEMLVGKGIISPDALATHLTGDTANLAADHLAKRGRGGTAMPALCYAGYRLPAEITNHSVWLYFRFPLSLRMVDELLAAFTPAAFATSSEQRHLVVSPGVV